MYIYIVRHGQSLGNLKGGFAGHTDYPLSELGHKQSRLTADFLKDENILRNIVLKSEVDKLSYPLHFLIINTGSKQTYK